MHGACSWHDAATAADCLVTFELGMLRPGPAIPLRMDM